MELRRLSLADEPAFRLALARTRRSDPDFAHFWIPGLGFGEYLKMMDERERGLALPPNHVPGTQLFGFVGDELVGRLSLRHQLNEFLSTVGGHIGYVVVPEHRRRGYATEMLQRSLPLAVARGLRRVLLTCDEGNFASRRVIERCGGRYWGSMAVPDHGEPKRHYWIVLPPASTKLQLRPEQPSDADAIRNLCRRAFGGSDEVRVVDAIRAAGAATLSLVALQEAGQLVGHILFTAVRIERAPGRTAETALGLGPMAVLPEEQRRGIGGRLVQEGLIALERAGHRAVVVLGHPRYYPRFGFLKASRFGLRCEYPCPDEAFMALELRAGALAAGPGLVRYRPEFSA